MTKGCSCPGTMRKTPASSGVCSGVGFRVRDFAVFGFAPASFFAAVRRLFAGMVPPSGPPNLVEARRRVEARLQHVRTLLLCAGSDSDLSHHGVSIQSTAVEPDSAPEGAP